MNTTDYLTKNKLTEILNQIRDTDSVSKNTRNNLITEVIKQWPIKPDDSTRKQWQEICTATLGYPTPQAALIDGGGVMSTTANNYVGVLMNPVLSGLTDKYTVSRLQYIRKYVKDDKIDAEIMAIVSNDSTDTDMIKQLRDYDETHGVERRTRTIDIRKKFTNLVAQLDELLNIVADDTDDYSVLAKARDILNTRTAAVLNAAEIDKIKANIATLTQQQADAAAAQDWSRIAALEADKTKLADELKKLQG